MSAPNNNFQNQNKQQSRQRLRMRPLFDFPEQTAPNAPLEQSKNVPLPIPKASEKPSAIIAPSVPQVPLEEWTAETFVFYWRDWHHVNGFPYKVTPKDFDFMKSALASLDTRQFSRAEALFLMQIALYNRLNFRRSSADRSHWRKPYFIQYFSGSSEHAADLETTWIPLYISARQQQ